MQDQRIPINLIGGGFQHSPSTSGFEPQFIRWIKNGTSASMSFYVDSGLKYDVNPKTRNFGWLVESKTIIKDIYKWCQDNISYLEQKFELIFTHDVELSKLSEKFILTQCSSKSFIKEYNLYDKTKLVSIIASKKNYCKEHEYRQQIVKKYSGKCDLYGRGYREIADKLEGLKDYCFSFAMENAIYPNMITEKITDCFATGTIPIYYGIPNINEFFNVDGIIILDENFDFNTLSFELYKSKKKAVEENFEISKNMLCAEDFIYKNFIK